ncbi:hypothetical protein KCU73_g553, partial [Aureobasidium melanogenum]
QFYQFSPENYQFSLDQFSSENWWTSSKVGTGLVHALSVTRCLIGLEVRKITFVGNAKLSYSNPYYVITASARMSMSEAEANRNGKGNGRGNGEGQDRG